jgi:2-polyprenyl-3-methyl-5-hydroxy-6-metoxy-1,4-benzoquinol methylase
MVKKDASVKFQWGSWQIGGPRHYYREALIMKTIKSVLSHGKVLDVGCGTGSLMLQLAHSGYAVNGTDLSEECIRLTKDHMKTFAPDVKPIIKRCNASNSR